MQNNSITIENSNNVCVNKINYWYFIDLPGFLMKRVLLLYFSTNIETNKQPNYLNFEFENEKSNFSVCTKHGENVEI